MAVYIIRPKESSVGKSLSLISRKFLPQSRQTQVEEVMQLHSENPVYQEINEWSNESQARGSKIYKSASNPGVTGTAILEMSEEEAEKAREELPETIVLRDQPIQLIQPNKLNIFKEEGELIDKDLWHLEAIRRVEKKLDGSGRGVTIAVLDTGIDGTHPALARKIRGAFELDLEGNQVNQIRTSIDDQGHGTHVAGLIAGQTIGVAPEVDLTSVILIPKGRGSLANFLLALDWSAQQSEIQIVNISAGIAKYVPELENPINDLLTVGILPICAIGNDGRDKTCSPGNYRGVVSVGAISNGQKVASFSGGGTMIVNNHNYTVPQLVAPGEEVFSSIVGGGYQAWSGTSMATPIVSGIAALILEKYPDLSVTDLIEALLSRCEDIGQPPDRQGKGAIRW
jgi:subtilisin family serine protease